MALQYMHTCPCMLDATVLMTSFLTHLSGHAVKLQKERSHSARNWFQKGQREGEKQCKPSKLVLAGKAFK